MKRSSVFVSLARYALLLCVSFAVQTSARQPSPPPKTAPHESVDLRQHPFARRQPVEVTIGIYITNLALVEETREEVETDGYLTLDWRDPRLALPEALRDKNHRRTFTPDQLWTPPLETENLVSHRAGSISLEADDDGNVRYVERSDTVISTSFALRKFPFDSQQIQFRVEPFLPAASEFRFASSPSPWTGSDLKDKSGLAAWRVKNVTYETSMLPPSGPIPARSRATFEIKIERRSAFYFWKIFLPMILMAAIPWSVFWYTIRDYDGQMSVPLGIVIALAAFEFSIARDLPRVGYITFLDAVFLISFVFVFLVIVEITLTYMLHSRGKVSIARKIRLHARWAFPAAYALLLLFLILVF